MFRDSEKTPPVPLHLRPGYVTDLHQRKPHTDTCDHCELAWPCAGVRRQLADACRFTNDFWFDETRFAAIVREVTGQVKAESARKAVKAAKKQEEAEVSA